MEINNGVHLLKSQIRQVPLFTSGGLGLGLVISVLVLVLVLRIGLVYITARPVSWWGLLPPP